MNYLIINYIIMLLGHETSEENLFKIINDGKLKPSSKTKIKYFNPYDKYLIYNFFNTIPDNIKSIKKLHKCCIFFDSSILLNHTFYINKNQSAGNIISSIKYKYSDINIINNILKKLYNYSHTILKKVMETNELVTYSEICIFQEIFIKIEPNLIKAKYITIYFANIKLQELITKKYPNIKIIIIY